MKKLLDFDICKYVMHVYVCPFIYFTNIQQKHSNYKKRCHFLKKIVIMSILNDNFSILTIDCWRVHLFNPTLLKESKDFLNFSKAHGDG